MISADEISFDADLHVYRSGDGIARPSPTRINQLFGLSDFSRIQPAVLEAARQRGNQVHLITAERDRTGEMPWDWASEDEMARLEAYEAFLHDRRGRIKWMAIEQPIIVQVSGMWIAGTPDRHCYIDADQWVVDLKTSETVQLSWDIQLADYSMMLAGHATLEKIRRMALQLLPSGKYKATERIDPSDGAAAIGMLAAATWMQHKGTFDPGASQ